MRFRERQLQECLGLPEEHPCSLMNLPFTHGVNWNELGRNYRYFRQQGIEVSIFYLLDCSKDKEHVTLLTLLDYSNIVRNMD